MKNKIFNELIRLSVPCDLHGFDYICTAVELLCEDFEKYRQTTINLYPEIARIHSTTSQRVERAIRYAVGLSISERNVNDNIEYFGRKKSITNSMFIATIARRIKMNEGE